jgi:hypothetical protein
LYSLYINNDPQTPGVYPALFAETRVYIEQIALTRMLQSVDVADYKDVWKVWQARYEDVVFTSLDGKFGIVRLQKRPLNNTVSKASATFRKTAPASLLSSKSC